MKTVLILVDGMRPDALQDVPAVQEMMAKASYALDAQTVYPSVTLPCHMSLFHSVDPGRHGTTDNIYMPQVRPVMGLCDLLARWEKRCAFFYNWEPLRDLSRPDALAFSFFVNQNLDGYEQTNQQVTEMAVKYLKEKEPDFAFIYLGWTDEAGHASGWMSEEYHRSVRGSWACIRQLMDAVSEEYAVIVTADHGGHDRSHGTRMPEDMTIPVFFYGKPFAAGKTLSDVSIKDIAPTIAALQGVKIPADWEGKCLV